MFGVWAGACGAAHVLRGVLGPRADGERAMVASRAESGTRDWKPQSGSPVRFGPPLEGGATRAGRGCLAGVRSHAWPAASRVSGAGVYRDGRVARGRARGGAHL